MPDNLNLTPKRGPNVWNRERGLAEQGATIASAVAGAVMLAAAAMTAVVGGRMLYRAVKEARRAAAADRPGALASTSPAVLRDIVAEESEDSFPASDAPSWTAKGATLDARRRR